jgi:tetratricopeptide (TPR) repeat protein
MLLMTRWIVVMLLAAAPMLAASLESGIDFYRTQRYQQAEKELRAVADAEPQNADAHFYLGLTLVEMERPEQAKAAFEKAKECALSPDKEKVAQARLDIAGQKLDAAFATLNEAEQINSENAELYLNRGLIHANRQEFPAAVKDFEKTLALAPKYARAHYYVGRAYNRTGRPDKMVEHFQIFLKLAPDSPDAPMVRSLMRSAR